MLTPNEVKEKLKLIDINSRLIPTAKQSLTILLYEEVLREIAKGSIDPKSLALAALREEI